jgi:uncharacterized Zn-finger protein
MNARRSGAHALLRWESEGGSVAAPALLTPLPLPAETSAQRAPGAFHKLRNDDGIPQIRIGMREFECIGASPPHDHPHIYLNMGAGNSMLCSFCATTFRYDAALRPGDVMPPECLYG